MKAIHAVAKDGVEALASSGGDNTILQATIRAGQCFLGAGMVTYQKKVGSFGQWSVWEVSFAGMKAYTSTDWRSSGEI